MRSTEKNLATLCTIMLALLLAVPPPLQAQQRRDRSAANAQAEEPFNPTGYWVSIITHDWVYRMTVPQRGQYTDIPINAAARQFADSWSAEKDEAAGKQCEAYGAAVIMQVPERLQIRWQDPNTLRVDTDAGLQTRLLRFGPSAEAQHTPPSWQGESIARWMIYAPGRGGRGGQSQGRRYGWLKISTTNMLPGLLRKNGLPYSAQTRMEENWVLNIEDDGDQWLQVTTAVDDPMYLSSPLVQDAIFRKEADGSKWDPTPCSLNW